MFKNSKKKGYITIEASLVFPIVFFITILVLGMVFMIHDQVIVRAKTDTVLMRSSIYYSDKYHIDGNDKDGRFGTVSKKQNLNMYWRFFNKNKIIGDGQEILNSHISRYDVFNEKNSLEKVKSKIGFFSFYNDVEIKRSNFLVGAVSRVMNLKHDGNHVYNNTMPIFDQGEFIRNLDLIKDVTIVLKNRPKK